MKNLIFLIFISISVQSFSQETVLIENDSAIAIVNTNKLSAMGNIVSAKYSFNLYNDSLVVNMTGGMGYKRALKMGVAKQVHLLECNTMVQGEIVTYKYENDEKSIVITLTDKRKVVMFRVKDSFTGKVSEMMYF